MGRRCYDFLALFGSRRNDTAVSDFDVFPGGVRAEVRVPSRAPLPERGVGARAGHDAERGHLRRCGAGPRAWLAKEIRRLALKTSSTPRNTPTK